MGSGRSTSSRRIAVTGTTGCIRRTVGDQSRVVPVWLFIGTGCVGSLEPVAVTIDTGAGGGCGGSTIRITCKGGELGRR